MPGSLAPSCSGQRLHLRQQFVDALVPAGDLRHEPVDPRQQRRGRQRRRPRWSGSTAAKNIGSMMDGNTLRNEICSDALAGANCSGTTCHTVKRLLRGSLMQDCNALQAAVAKPTDKQHLPPSACASTGSSPAAGSP
jgi:hypothetical protein